MDNLTHTLIGTLIGDTVARATARESADSGEQGLPASLRRNLLVTFAAIGSNLPDIDLAYSFFGGKLNYLLQHRGHSHTIVAALVLAASMLALTELWLRRGAMKPSRSDRIQLAAVTLLTPLLHIGMDFTNNYGVHPFWPFYNGWFYGDSVFIAEPLIWAACAPLVFTLRTQTARTLVAVLLAAGVALTLLIDMIPLTTAITFVLVLGVMLWVGHRMRPLTALTAGIALWISVTIMFVTSGHVVAGKIDAVAARTFGEARLLDRVLTPMPANPLCWQILLVQDENDRVALRRAMLALAPSLVPADRCIAVSRMGAASAHSAAPPLPSSPSPLPRTTAPLKPIELPSDDSLTWYDEIVSPRDELATLARTNCEVAAALRFMRAPWIASVEGRRILGDLRYDREPELGFAEIEVHEPAGGCPRFVPPWIQPRADVLLPVARSP